MYKRYRFKIVYDDGISEDRIIIAISNIDAWNKVTLFTTTKSFREKIDIVGINLLNNGKEERV